VQIGMSVAVLTIVAVIALTTSKARPAVG